MGIEGQHYTVDSSGQPVQKPLTNEERVKMGMGSYVWTMKRSYISTLTKKDVRDFLLNDNGIRYAIVQPLDYVSDTWMATSSALGLLKNQYISDLVTKKDINFDTLFDEYIKAWNDQGGAKATQELNDHYSKK
jgi:hypothetical protein